MKRTDWEVCVFAIANERDTSEHDFRLPSTQPFIESSGTRNIKIMNSKTPISLPYQSEHHCLHQTHRSSKPSTHTNNPPNHHPQSSPLIMINARVLSKKLAIVHSIGYNQPQFTHRPTPRHHPPPTATRAPITAKIARLKPNLNRGTERTLHDMYA